MTKIFALFTLFAAAMPLPAQVLYGTLTGTVEDTSGAVVAGAPVKVSNEAIGQARETTTNAAGTFTATNLSPGIYSVEIALPGFRAFRRTGIEVTINTVTRADVQLQVGEVSERVNVEASAVVLQTEKADVHVELGSREVTTLPIGGYRTTSSLSTWFRAQLPPDIRTRLSVHPAAL